MPRLGANILVDIFPATEASAYLYTGEERTRIQEVSFTCRTSSKNVLVSATWAELDKNK